MTNPRHYSISFRYINEDDLAELLEGIPGGAKQAARSDAVLRMLLDHGLDQSSVRVHDSR